MWEMEVRFMREAWVLLSWGVGEVICWKLSVETAISVGAGGGQV